MYLVVVDFGTVVVVLNKRWQDLFGDTDEIISTVKYGVFQPQILHDSLEQCHRESSNIGVLSSILHTAAN